MTGGVFVPVQLGRTEIQQAHAIRLVGDHDMCPTGGKVVGDERSSQRRTSLGGDNHSIASGCR